MRKSQVTSRKAQGAGSREQRRAEIGANARATLEALREGRARYGTVDDLRRELAAEE